MQPKIQNATFLQPNTTRIKKCVIIQQKRNFCLPKVPFLFIHCENNGISSPKVHIINRRLYRFRNDDIPRTVLRMICNSVGIDDIQGFALICFQKNDIICSINDNLWVYAMELELIELTHKTEIFQTYEIYKHCMFMPTEEKFNKKIDQFLNDNSIKIFACFNQGEIEGVIVVSFVEQSKIEIIGIAVDLSARGKGIGSYIINQVINNYCLHSVYAETDIDAVGFYQKNDFSITEFYKTYDGEAVVRYKCELTK